MLFNEILKDCKFNPIFSFDEVTTQHEIRLDEIGIYSFAATLEETIPELIELVIDATEDYFEQIDLYMNSNLKNQFPYFLKIYRCRSSEEIIELLNLKI